MAKYYVMGNFSQKGVKGFLTGESNRESVVKAACEAMGCKFIFIPLNVFTRQFLIHFCFSGCNIY